MVRQVHIALWLLIVAVVIGGCQKGHERDCFKGGGDKAEEEREVASFSRIFLDDNINLVLTQDTVQHVRVRAGENLLDGIRTELDETGMLRIENENRCNWVRERNPKITVFLSVIQLEYMAFLGSGIITSANTLQIDELEVVCDQAGGSVNIQVKGNQMITKVPTGAADVTIAGEVDYSYVFVAGVGFVYQQNLQTDTTHINCSGLGDVYTGTANHLVIEIYNKGSVYYQGDPILEAFADEGEGRLIQVQD